MTCDCRSLPPSSLLSHGTRSRPDFSWMPTPGPVAYQVHSGRFTSFVISAGLSHVAPSSVLFVIQTVRDPLLVPDTILASVSSRKLWVMSSQTVPVFRSTTGQGFPHTLVPSSQTT